MIDDKTINPAEAPPQPSEQTAAPLPVDHGLWPVGHGVGNDALDRVPSRSDQ